VGALYTLTHPLVKIMTATKLLHWHRAWQLQGNTVSCRRCGARQEEADGDANFLHFETCLPRELAKTPWTALKNLVATEIRG
jgi:hypothetical protein